MWVIRVNKWKCCKLCSLCFMNIAIYKSMHWLLIALSINSQMFIFYIYNKLEKLAKFFLITRQEMRNRNSGLKIEIYRLKEHSLSWGKVWLWKKVRVRIDIAIIRPESEKLRVLLFGGKKFRHRWLLVRNQLRKKCRKKQKCLYLETSDSKRKNWQRSFWGW